MTALLSQEIGFLSKEFDDDSRLLCVSVVLKWHCCPFVLRVYNSSLDRLITHIEMMIYRHFCEECVLFSSQESKHIHILNIENEILSEE